MTRSVFAPVCAAAVGFVCTQTPAPAHGQPASAIVLRPPNGEISHGFTTIQAIRELADGRVLIVDAREVALFVGDFRKSSVMPLGRKGSGPGEYRTARELVAISADSTIFPDNRNGRWNVLVGARMAATLPPETPAVSLTPGLIRGADRFGHVLTRRGRAALTDPSAFAESLVVVLIDRRSGRADSVARIRPQPVNVLALGQGRGSRSSGLMFMSMPFTTAEQAILFGDGWIAVARLDPYRVDWRSPDGQWTYGPPLPSRQVRLDDREKRAYLQRLARVTGRPQDPASLFVEGVSVIAPFEPEPDGLLASPDGRLVIRRMPTADVPDTRYDLVDRRGLLVGRLELAENERLVGFGVRSAYVAITDDSGLQRLRRHSWP